MPNMFVFPGGRLDPADRLMRTETGLPPEIEQKLVARMRGRPSLRRARGLAFAAVRETFEEVGLVIGRKGAFAKPAPSAEWETFLATGYCPDLASLRFVMRAITPPGRTRRFDTRFFIADSEAVTNLDHPIHNGSGELLEANWFTFAAALELDLPRITREVLERVSTLVDGGGWPQPGDPVPFQYQLRGRWHEDLL